MRYLSLITIFLYLTVPALPQTEGNLPIVSPFLAVGLPLIRTALPRFLRRLYSASITRLRHYLGVLLIDVVEALRDKEDDFGPDPCDRRYIDTFITLHASDIRGRVLEFAPVRYASNFAPVHLDVMSKDEGPGILTCDLAAANLPLPAAQYDCIICTQVLGFVAGLEQAVLHLHDLLKPGGVLLLSINSQGRVGRYDAMRYGYRTRLTQLSVRELLENAFETVEVTAYGNTYAVMAALNALPAFALDERKLQAVDPRCPLTIVARAVKAEACRTEVSLRGASRTRRNNRTGERQGHGPGGETGWLEEPL
jgi:hypothetical protein